MKTHIRSRMGKRAKLGDGKQKQRPIHEKAPQAKKPVKAPKPGKPGPAKAKPAPNPAQGQYNPFSNPESTILLVGEGDFSFSRSLIDNHGCFKMVCTSFDSKEEVFEKYPQAKETVEYLTTEEQTVLHSIDAKKLATYKKLKNKSFERIVFMFPHVGGISKDVERQTLANQGERDFVGRLPQVLNLARITPRLLPECPQAPRDRRQDMRDAVRRSFLRCLGH